jgi:hypothetical protein
VRDRAAGPCRPDELVVQGVAVELQSLPAVGAAPRPVVAGDRPHEAGLGLATPGIEHRAARSVTDNFGDAFSMPTR